MGRDDAKKYINCFLKRPGSGLKAKFPNVDPASVDILESMLKFSPKVRVTVDKALEHPLFQTIRNRKKETAAPQLVVLAFEKEKELLELALRKNFCKEIKKYHPEVPDL